MVQKIGRDEVISESMGRKIKELGAENAQLKKALQLWLDAWELGLIPVVRAEVLGATKAALEAKK
jgi:hypothetical protein